MWFFLFVSLKFFLRLVWDVKHELILFELHEQEVLQTDMSQTFSHDSENRFICPV